MRLIKNLVDQDIFKKFLITLCIVFIETLLFIKVLIFLDCHTVTLNLSVSIKNQKKLFTKLIKLFFFYRET